MPFRAEQQQILHAMGLHLYRLPRTAETSSVSGPETSSFWRSSAAQSVIRFAPGRDLSHLAVPINWPSKQAKRMLWQSVRHYLKNS